MDKRSWPWKRKSSDKQLAEKAPIPSTASSDGAATQADQTKQDNKKPKYVQISMESYAHLTGLEDQVKSYDEQVKSYDEQVKILEGEIQDLNEKLSAAHSEMTDKENLVKQHAKVAEEAVSGWEKAESEAAELKNHLESVTLLKLTAEDRASHLDGALKECMRQIRLLKEEHDQALQELVLNKTKQFDKMKLELEARIADFEQELLRSNAENSTLSRSLQERSNMLIKLSEEKSLAEEEIECLKSDIESCEKEINSLKYELHIARKEAEIYNEEKNMSVRSAEVANKHHLEGVKKIAKLEAECQRLRGLVRKKLPGPAALAQMKLEVENLGRDYGESRLKRSPVKPSTPHLSQMPEFSPDNMQKYQKENELLTERLLAMEEETLMLKEALAKRNGELQTSRSTCAKTASKLQSLETQLHVNSEQRSTAKPKDQIPIAGLYTQDTSNPPSFTTISENGNDDAVSCAGSWATSLMSDLSHFKKEKNVNDLQKSQNANNVGLMDDFLEMEKLAYNDSCEAVSTSDISVNEGNAEPEIVNHDTSTEITSGTDSHSREHRDSEAQLQTDLPIIMKLKSRISMVLESMSENDMEKVLLDIKRVVQDMHDTLHHQAANCVVEATLSDTVVDSQTCAEDAEITVEKEKSLSGDGKPCIETANTINHELEVAISQIFNFVMILDKEAKTIQRTSPDGDGVNRKLDTFSAKYNEVINKRTDLIDFVLDLSHVLREASELHFNVLGYKNSEIETGSSDCIDKIALPENKGVVELSGERYPNGCAHFSDPNSDPDFLNDGILVPTSDSTATSWKCSLQEFEQLKLEKDNMATDLATCTESLESTKSQLFETEQLLAEVKSQLTSAQKSNSLAETQLKCMAESYKSLETRAEELQTEINLLHGKIESLDNDLQEERRNHQDALTRCKDLQEQLQRIENCSTADNDAKTNQEKELAAAAEKLAECQETIFLLGKQLKTLRPQSESVASPRNVRSGKGEDLNEEEPTISGTNLQDTDRVEIDTGSSTNLQRAGSESPLDLHNSMFSPSDTEANNLLRSPVSSKPPKHRPTMSGSSSSSSTPTPEKHSRGFSRFFSSKGNNGY
ncbi:unnamed protein product [Fraxinus pennsylvanica]|uniref:Filament-like plant protein 4 n=1 Tax=Fraxinus pennsylvanica TaxID=56036 RepID=A0AAD2DQX2_9LAMI|nr:unnamed protein product [Fraxinus pennsylvanica]